jgi:hypothetical protein
VTLSVIEKYFRLRDKNAASRWTASFLGEEKSAPWTTGRWEIFARLIERARVIRIFHFLIFNSHFLWISPANKHSPDLPFFQFVFFAQNQNKFSKEKRPNLEQF